MLNGKKVLFSGMQATGNPSGEVLHVRSRNMI